METNQNYTPSGFHNDSGEPILLPESAQVLRHAMGVTGPIITVKLEGQGTFLLPVREVPA